MNLLGGRGECSHCHQWHNNVSYHEAQDCMANPHSMACRIMADQIAEEESLVKSPGLQIKCSSCKNPLVAPGGLLFSPPMESNMTQDRINGVMLVRKYHLCLDCYVQVWSVLKI